MKACLSVFFYFTLLYTVYSVPYSPTVHYYSPESTGLKLEINFNLSAQCSLILAGSGTLVTARYCSVPVIRAVDPHSFYADPDPAIFLNADPDPGPDPGPA